jgi:farnesyl-diphosphate farnesyltransferase
LRAEASSGLMVGMSQDDESAHEKELGGKLLASVSRSFYLTLKALPKALREPISLAYLLARTADTMADTAGVPETVRMDCLRLFDQLIREPDPAGEARLVAQLKAEFAPLQTDAAEKRLMETVSGALAWLATMRDRPREAVLEVLERIIAGQILDIERFPGDGRLRSLQTADELYDYTWRVAGCVGEFWTRLCESELTDAFEDGVTAEAMVADGIGMGKALQLINILRDVGKDMKLGRCYLPEEDWRKAGVTDVEEIRSGSARLRPVWEHWAKVCDGHLEEGLRYVCRLRHAKLRYATALPLMLAFGTLRKLRSASWDEVLAGVKVSRLDVARLLTETLMTSRSAAGLRAQAERWGAK